MPGLDRIRLFRAVMPAEAASIAKARRFINPPSVELKYFATSLQGALQYAAMAFNMYGDGPFSFVETAIDLSLLQGRDRVTVDGGIKTVTVRTNLLTALDEPELMVQP